MYTHNKNKINGFKLTLKKWITFNYIFFLNIDIIYIEVDIHLNTIEIYY